LRAPIEVSYTSTFDLFKIGIGPSSSHTVGPMLAALDVSTEIGDGVRIELYGSLSLTGLGHGTDRAIMLGLSGYHPATVPLELVWELPRVVRETGRLTLADGREVQFRPENDIIRHREIDPAHPNVLRFTTSTGTRAFASIGGGSLATITDGRLDEPPPQRAEIPHQFRSAEDLLRQCGAHGVPIAELARRNESALDPSRDVDRDLAQVTDVMRESIDRGMRATGTLPGALGIPRRARNLGLDLMESDRSLPPTGPSDWAGVYATAVNEENAAGGRIVTAPTNGAAGIVPAVLRFASEFCSVTSADTDSEFLLTATAIGSLLKANAGISGAELGCQGEVGSASAMAAAGLAAVLGGTPEQIENAAEIALEHNLGLTCDPVAGLVQVPCIERNAIGAIKSIAATSLALRGTGEHFVSLDVAIETMRQTGLDMHHKYKETSLGGLAVNVPAC
jgi:L-serine dehydratase